MTRGTELWDVVGVGFGPANLALAIALEEQMADRSAVFLEAQEDPVWQAGMMIAGSDIQHHPCRDLVTLRNPRSRYTFLNYLFEAGRLLAHLNVPGEFPLRKEYARYIQWATREMSRYARFGQRVREIRLEEFRGEPVWSVVDAAGAEHCGRSLVLGTGRSPRIPPVFAGCPSARIKHLTEYLPAVEAIEGTLPASIAVVGGSQSAVEIALDLTWRFPRTRIDVIVRGLTLRLKDTSPFSEEIFFPQFTDYYYRADLATRRRLDGYTRPTNYSSADRDVLDALYREIHEQRLDEAQRTFVLGHTDIQSVSADADGAKLILREEVTGEVAERRYDLVVLATGFKDMGRAEDQEPSHPLLRHVTDRFQWDPAGHLGVREDYSLVAIDDDTPSAYLNGLCESTHGIGDAGSFSLLSIRSDVICRSLMARLVRPYALLADAARADD